MSTLRAALDHLDTHVNLEATAGAVHGLSLERMRTLCAVLGDPQDAFRSVHVTGTNGKGSVARMTTELLRATGLGVGTYTSPHLESITERIAYDGDPIAPDVFASLIAELAEREVLLADRPSYFELLTAAAFRWFADLPVDVAVVEVGLLGRFDATNVIDADVAVLTNVGKDHTDGAGDWRRRIAEEKVGIVKPGSTFVLGETDPDLADVFASAPAGEVWVSGRDFDVVDDRVALGGRLVSLSTPSRRVDDIFIPLHGAHQATNAAIALAATEAMLHHPISDDDVRAAFASLRMPGRFEVVSREPTVVLDGAHNPDGARVAAATLRDEFTLTGTVVLVVGMLTGRDPREMLEALGARDAGYLIACTPASPRALPAAELAGVADRLGVVAESVPDVRDALRRALALATAEDVVVVSGSLYVVGEARSALIHSDIDAATSRGDAAERIVAWDEAYRRSRSEQRLGAGSGFHFDDSPVAEPDDLDLGARR